MCFIMNIGQKGLEKLRFAKNFTILYLDDSLILTLCKATGGDYNSAHTQRLLFHLESNSIENSDWKYCVQAKAVISS